MLAPMSAAKARTVALLYTELAEVFADLADSTAAAQAEAQAEWWSAYAVALSQPAPGPVVIEDQLAEIRRIMACP